MSRRGAKRTPGQTATASTPEGELQRHLRELGLESAEIYRAWCAAHGFRPGLQKTWQERRAEVRTAQRLAQEAAERRELEKHAADLGFADLDAYSAWRRERGFPASMRLTPEQRRRERETLERERARSAMAGARQRARRPDDVLRAIAADTIAAEELRTPALQKAHAVFAGIQDTGVRDSLLRLLLHARAHTELLSPSPVIPHFGPQPGNTFIEALAGLAAWHGCWLREPEEWRPDSRSSRRQFAGLARHLLARYFVPSFMDEPWFIAPGPEAARRQGWFIHVGVGQNIRKADIPLHLTKMMAHHFLLAPKDVTLVGALRWGQLLALGGDGYLARAVAATRLGELQEDEPFWESFLHFLVNNPMLDRACIGPMADFIHHRRFERVEAVEDGQAVLLEPPEPGFSMKGRTVPALWKRVEEWHRELARLDRRQPQEWPPSGIGGLELTERDEETGKRVRWHVMELLTHRELVEEGRDMHHCVASYSRSCARGATSIWSIRLEDREGYFRRVMTVEVHNGRRSIVQARGVCNKSPNGRRASTRLQESPRILRMWAAQERLTVPGHLFP